MPIYVCKEQALADEPNEQIILPYLQMMSAHLDGTYNLQSFEDDLFVSEAVVEGVLTHSAEHADDVPILRWRDRVLIPLRNIGPPHCEDEIVWSLREEFILSNGDFDHEELIRSKNLLDIVKFLKENGASGDV